VYDYIPREKEGEEKEKENENEKQHCTSVTLKETNQPTLEVREKLSLS
jgi:hypothetical protein